MQSVFTVLAALGDFRHNVQCNICGHTFVHRSGSENSVNITATLSSPLCPVCKAQDEMQPVEVVAEMNRLEALAEFGIIVTLTPEKGKEPWEVYDSSMRRSFTKTQESCIEQGKEWLSQDIHSEQHHSSLTAKQAAAIKTLFDTATAGKLLAYCCWQP